MTDHQQQWEEAFDTLDKRAFSVDAIGGYDFYRFLERYAGPESKILDYGCGKGQLVVELSDKGHRHVYGADPSARLIEQAEKYPEKFQVIKDHRAPYEDQSFDLIYTSGVLHHISWGQLPLFLADVKRLLRPGGIFIYIEPRNSLPRKLGHVAVLSPFSRLYHNAHALAECLRAEWPTYYPWLQREQAEFIPLCQQHGFSFVEKKHKLFTVIGVLKNG